MTSKNIRHRFGANVLVDLTTGCHEWQGAHTQAGYGIFTLAGRRRLAHRVAFLWVHGYEPRVVRHECDNPCCVSAAHLLPGDAKSNAKDRDVRGRARRAPTAGRRRQPLSEAARVAIELWQCAWVSCERIRYITGYSRQQQRVLAKSAGLAPRTRGPK